MEEIFNSTPSLPSYQTTIYYDRATKLDWILPILFNLLLNISTFWLLLSLIYYGIKTKKWSGKRAKMDALNSGLVYSSVVACAIMCIFRYVVSLVSMTVGFNERDDDLCDAIGDTAFCAYALILCCVALFLWFRQRSFYANRMLNVNYNIVIKIFSYSSIVFVIAYGMFVIILNTLPNGYLSTPRGCVLNSKATLKSHYWIAIIVGVIFYNVALLGLLCYALTHVQSYQAKQKLQKSNSTRAAKSTGFIEPLSPVNQSSFDFETNKQSFRGTMRQRKPAATKIKFILQKTIIFASISILCDVFLQVFAIYITKSSSHRRVSNILFDFNSFLNLVFLIFSFASYKRMILVPFRKNCGQITIRYESGVSRSGRHHSLALSTVQ